jgi:dipeptidyl aminopeptidase/acylaminoacyl peptidase
MKKVFVFFAVAALLALSSVVAGTAVARAGIQRRSGTVAFLRTVGDGPSGLFTIGADGSGLRRLTPSRSNVASYEWAPDGGRIAYLDRRGALWLVRPDGTGRELLAASSPLRNPWSVSWSPDGKAIAVIAYDPAEGPVNPSRGLGHRRIYVIPTDRGEPRRLPGGYVGFELSWSPRGDEIAYGSASARH